jgi:thymidylate synthase (FAD)
MKLIQPYCEILTPIDRIDILKRIEVAGRTAYKSEEKITEDSASNFVKGVIKRGHESVIEHVSLSVKFVCDRGISHELVRHRLASFTQESTRFCNYSKDKFDNRLTFVIPEWCNVEPGKYVKDIEQPAYSMHVSDSQKLWVDVMWNCETSYLELLNQGWTPQQARSVLPNSLKTEVIMSANLREWRHILKVRCAQDAHPQMRELMIPLQKELAGLLPEIFHGSVLG